MGSKKHRGHTVENSWVRNLIRGRPGTEADGNTYEYEGWREFAAPNTLLRVSSDGNYDIPNNNVTRVQNLSTQMY